MSLKIFLRYQLTNQIHRVSGILHRAPAILCLSQNFLSISCRKAPKALKTLLVQGLPPPYYKVLSKLYDNEIDFNKEAFTQFAICMQNKFLHKSKTVSRLGPEDEDYVVPDEEILGNPVIQPLANAISNIADYHVFERTRRRFLASWEPYPGALQSLRIEDDP